MYVGTMGMFDVRKKVCWRIPEHTYVVQYNLYRTVAYYRSDTNEN